MEELVRQHIVKFGHVKFGQHLTVAVEQEVGGVLGSISDVVKIKFCEKGRRKNEIYVAYLYF